MEKTNKVRGGRRSFLVVADRGPLLGLLWGCLSACLTSRLSGCLHDVLRASLRLSLSLCVCMCACGCAYACARVGVCVCTCACVCVYMSVHVHVHKPRVISLPYPLHSVQLPSFVLLRNRQALTLEFIEKTIHIQEKCCSSEMWSCSNALRPNN